MRKPQAETFKILVCVTVNFTGYTLQSLKIYMADAGARIRAAVTFARENRANVEKSDMTTAMQDSALRSRGSFGDRGWASLDL